MADKQANVAEIHVLKNAAGPTLKVLVPKGTTLAETFKLQDMISEITRGLNGCQACNSGVPVEFIEQSDLSEIVRVDLATMQRV
jgi:hypothetical protein